MSTPGRPGRWLLVLVLVAVAVGVWLATWTYDLATRG